MGLFRLMFTGRWSPPEEVHDTREDFLVGPNGQPLAIEYTGATIGDGDYNTGNHEDVLHDGTPHRDPVVRKSWNPLSWFFFAGQNEIRRYPINVSQDGRVADMDYLEAYAKGQNGIINLANGRRVRIVELSNRDVDQLERQEDQLQRGRGVRRGNLKRSERWGMK